MVAVGDQKGVVVYVQKDEDGDRWLAEVFDDRPSASAWIEDVRYLPDIWPQYFFQVSDAQILW